MQTKRNEATISKAFNGLKHNEHQLMISALKGILDAAVVFALQRHEEMYLHNHLETGDSYGWALGYQGECIAIKVTTWEDLPTTNLGITQTLTDLVCSLSSSKDKYVGVVMAGMEPTEYYNLMMEEMVLADTKDFVASDFDRYFQKI